MNWLTDYIRPKIRSLVQRDVPDNLWTRCDSCAQMILTREMNKNQRVCPHCDHHHRLSVSQRFQHLFDEEDFERIKTPDVATDPLKFRDKKKYLDRLRDTRNRQKEDDALAVAVGKVGAHSTVIAAFNMAFMGGSMGMAVGEALLTAADKAVKLKAPLLVITASGGARMQEGILSLMQMPRSILAVNRVKEAGLPYIVLLADPTTGGVTASFAMLGDIHLAEAGAEIGFAGARVIEQTIRENLPEGFQRAEYLQRHGVVDRVVHRKNLRQELQQLFDLLLQPVKDPGKRLSQEIPAVEQFTSSGSGS